MPYWRTTRESLHPGSRVCFPAEVTVREQRIEPGTKGIVTDVPGAGEVTVAIVDGKLNGEKVAVLPEHLAHGGTTAAIRWEGKVVEVAPGIGVELLATEREGYVAFVWQQLERILATQAGRAIVASFDAGREQDFVFPAGRPFTDAPYQGLTLLIGQPRPKYTTAAPPKRLVFPQIRTMDVGARTGPVTRDNAGTKIPRIDFFDRPAADEAEIEIGKADGAKFTHEGVRGHADFPDTVQDFDLVLYHELVHAHLSNRGVAARIRDARVERAIAAQNHDEAEEELVVGLLAGRGLPLSENAYRCQTGRPLRKGYRDSNLADPEVTPADWNEEITLIEAASRWKDRRHLDPKDAHWIATGKDL